MKGKTKYTRKKRKIAKNKGKPQFKKIYWEQTNENNRTSRVLNMLQSRNNQKVSELSFDVWWNLKTNFDCAVACKNSWTKAAFICSEEAIWKAVLFCSSCIHGLTPDDNSVRTPSRDSEKFFHSIIRSIQ